MKNKYIVLDEVRLELATLDREVALFDNKKHAIEFADHICLASWQVIEVPFGELNDGNITL